jgi:hypothetical protein
MQGDQPGTALTDKRLIWREHGSETLHGLTNEIVRTKSIGRGVVRFLIDEKLFKWRGKKWRCLDCILLSKFYYLGACGYAV